MSQSPFGEKSFEKLGLRQLRKNLGRNSTRQEYAPGGLKLQGKIAGLGAEHGDENIQSLLAHRTLAAQRSPGNGGCRIRFHHLGYQPLRRLAAAGLAQKFKNVHQTRSGEDALVADVSSVARPQMLEELDLNVVDRGEVGVASLGGKNVMPLAIPVKAAFPEPGAGGDDGLIPLDVFLLENAVQRNQITRRQSSDAPAGRFEVVDQGGFGEIEFQGKPACLDNPWQVRGFYSSVGHRSGDTEAGLRGLKARGPHEFRNDLVQAGVSLAGENGEFCQVVVTAIHFVEG